MQPSSIPVLRIVAVLLSTASVASAQSQLPSSPGTQPQPPATSTLVDAITERVKEQARVTKRQAQRDPLVRSGLTLPEPQLSFETVKTNGRATGTIGFVQQQAAGEMSYLFAVSAPIGSTPDAESRPIDLRASQTVQP